MPKENGDELEMFPSCCSPRKEEPPASCPVFNRGCGLHWVPLMFLYHCQSLPVADSVPTAPDGEGGS